MPTGTAVLGGAEGVAARVVFRGVTAATESRTRSPDVTPLAGLLRTWQEPTAPRRPRHMGGTTPGMGSCHRGAIALHREILVGFDPPGPQGAPAMTTTSIPTLAPTVAPTLAELVDRLDDAVRAPGPGLDVPHA